MLPTCGRKFVALGPRLFTVYFVVLLHFLSHHSILGHLSFFRDAFVFVGGSDTFGLLIKMSGRTEFVGIARTNIAVLLR